MLSSPPPQVSVDRIHVRYEDPGDVCGPESKGDEGPPSPPRSFTLGCVLDHMQLSRCSEACCVRPPGHLIGPEMHARIPAPALLKHYVVSWSGLAIYLNPGVFGDVCLPDFSPGVAAGGKAFGGNWTGLDLDKVQVVLAPSSGKLSIMRTRTHTHTLTLTHCRVCVSPHPDRPCCTLSV